MLVVLDALCVRMTKPYYNHNDISNPVRLASLPPPPFAPGATLYCLGQDTDLPHG